MRIAVWSLLVCLFLMQGSRPGLEDLNSWKRPSSEQDESEIEAAFEVKEFKALESMAEARCEGANANWGLDQSENSIQICALRTLLEPGREVLVAVVDTGVDVTHPELQGSIRTLREIPEESPAPQFKRKFIELPKEHEEFMEGIKRENEARRIDKERLFSEVSSKDFIGHGTHVAGIIEAVAKSAFFLRENPIYILPLRFYSSETLKDETTKDSVHRELDGNSDETIKAFTYAIKKGARIINYSAGGYGFSAKEYQILKEAEKKGVLVVAAAGNNSQDLSKPNHSYYPASYGLSNIISVAAIEPNGNLMSVSNYGMRVDLAAPGKNIRSLNPGEGYAYLSGTSQATAFVTGVAALLLSQDPSLKPSDIKQLLNSSASPRESLKHKVKSGGILNAEGALRALKKRKSNKPAETSHKAKLSFKTPRIQN